ncbi:hypothetical protein BG015_010622 [Linnemannia schmuckeri]|uniref:F-box domain-containing protein n=1 Tax=Linnemannia schmuckeri TaxID=64567 RepID=A0A9P5S8P8_9FUNG|nr:hypothetical protein BG015_010622 [Linnemannia schmuckeri]
MVHAGADRWEALVKALKKNYERDMAIRHSLRDLELIDYIHICIKLCEILPFLATLTRLRLQVAEHGTIRLDKIFQACPFLESFEAEAKNYVEFSMPWPLLLQSFVLRNGHFAQSDLGSLLALTPRLQELKLISLQSGVWIEEDETNLAHISTLTMACLESHGIVLRSFHFSRAYTSKSSSQCAMFLVSPKSTDWTFSTQDLLPIIQDTSNVVTRPEIHHQDRAKLLLDSIHVQRDFPHETKAHSRVVYCYRSIVCPKLRDLRIDPYYQAVLLSRSILFMDLDAGLCLLSRLRYLETLLIGSAGMTTTSGSRDLTWMIASGWTAEARKEREKIMSGWKTTLLEETRQRSVAPLRTLEGPYVDADLTESLQDLGLLEDVKNTLDKMG